MSGQIETKLTALATIIGNITDKLASDTSAKIGASDYASSTKAGIVKPDGTTITVGENGVISAKTSTLEGLTASVAELNYSKGVTSNIQTQLNAKANASSLSTVATSGSYEDLTDKPSIPTITDTYSATSANGMSGKAVASAISGKANSASTLAGYGITDAYTKTEVDNKVSSVYKYKGSVARYSALPTTGQVVGDVYNVESADKTHGIKAGDNVAWTGSAWDVLSGTVDLSEYAKSADLSTVATSGSYDDLSNKPSIPTVTDTYSATSSNAMSGKAVSSAISGKVDTSSLATVATSGSYEDLTSKPSIPTVTGTYSATSDNAMSGKAVASAISGKANTADLATVATSGSYDDLSNKPTIPAAVTETTVSGWGFTKSTGTLTGVKMNNVSKTVTGGVVDLGTVITEHQDISGKQDNLSPAQLLAANSGITASKVSAYDGYATTIAGKANTADLADVATSGSYKDLEDKPSIPSAVTEDTVSGWGFTKNSGTYSKPSTGIPKTDLASAVQTSLGKADTALQSIASSDVTTALGFTPYNATNPNGYTSNKGTVTSVNNVAPVDGNVTLSIPSAVTEATVSGWGFTKNAGTITGATMNGSTVTATNGVLALGTVLTAHQDISGKSDVGHKHTAADITSGLATVATSGSYDDLSNKPTIPAAVTETTVSGWGFTKNAGTVTKVNNVSPVDGNVTLSIPTVTDTYSATSSNAMSGKAVASAISNKADASDIPTDYVPNTRTINNKALSGNITLSASDVGATTMAAVEAKGYLTQHQSLANYYNKTEIDGKLTGAMHFKGTVDKVSDLPTGAATGDMYNVKSTGANYAWDGTAWDKLSENIDLSGVVPTTRTVNGKALSADITLNAGDVGATTMAAVEAKGYLVASDIAGKADSSSLATVATSGNYNDLTNKPTIPSAVTETTVSGWGFTKNAGTVTGVKMNNVSKTITNGVVDLGTVITAHQDISGKSDVGHKHAASDITSGLATVATSGSYNDLSDKPSIPSAVTETTVSGWGFTKNAGTVTSVNNVTPVNGNITLTIPSAITETTVSGWGFTKNAGTVTSVNNVAPVNGNVTISIPSAVTETTVSGWGFTKNAGTLTGVKMNGAAKTVTNGVVDLGTVLTSHQDISGKTDEATLESAIDSLTTQLNNAAK